jgi:hypothetical protein
MSELEKEILDKVLWSERVIKKYVYLLDNIINFNSNFKICKFPQKVYNYYYNITINPVCKSCGKDVKFFNRSYSIFCSNICSTSDSDINKKRQDTFKKTMLDTYGVESSFSIPGIRDKIIKTFNENYGVDVPATLDSVKLKIVESRSKLDESEITKKRKGTCLVKYGVDSCSKLDFVKKKQIETNNKLYGGNSALCNKEIQDKRTNNYRDKTGLDHHFHNKEILDNMQLSRIKTLGIKYTNGLELDIIDYKTGFVKLKCYECGNISELSTSLLYQRTNRKVKTCLICNPLNDKTTSSHLEISDFLNDIGILHILNDRKILDGLELDIYSSDYNIAIEFNGLYWHSELHKNKSYHLDKTKKCESKGIRLIHIFQDDWLNKKDIVKSILLNAFGKINDKIYARKCIIKEVSPKDSRTFLDSNHIQGYASSKIKLGLYYNNELVSLLTLGNRNTNKKDEFELIRFCSKLNLSVIGGASKLFKYFLNNFNYGEIVSYSDYSIFGGSLYEGLKFERSHLSPPNYWWVVDGIRRHRFNFNKKKLVKLGHDTGKSEVMIMLELGYYRIFGCGQVKWVYKR